MNLDITSYLKIYPTFDDKFCKDTIEQLENVEWRKHAYTSPANNYEAISYDAEFSVCSLPIANEQVIMNGIWQALFKYCSELNFSWIDGWSGHSPVRFNKYDVETLMREHCDHIHSLFSGERRGVPILSALGTLNDNFTGGELIFWKDKKIVIPPGSIAVFPSNFLFPHLVTPVKEGVRYSYVSWAW